MKSLRRKATDLKTITCRMSLLSAAFLIVLGFAANHYAQWLRPGDHVNILAPGIDVFRLQPFGPRTGCSADTSPAPERYAARSPPTMQSHKAAFSENPILGSDFRVKAVTAMDKLFVIDSSQILYAKLFIDEGEGWRQSAPWHPGEATDGFVNPAFFISLPANKDIRLHVCFQTASGMTPLFSIREIGNMLDRQRWQSFSLGAMLSIMLLAALIAFKFWKISGNDTLSLAFLATSFAACLSFFAIGLWALISPWHDPVLAAKVQQICAALVFTTFFRCVVSKLKMQYASPPMGGFLQLFSLSPLLLLPVIYLNYKCSQDILILMGLANAFILFAIAIGAMNRDRQAHYYVAISGLAMLIGMSYVFAWFDMLPSEWVTTLCSAFGPALSLSLSLFVFSRIHDSQRYLATQVRHGSRAFTREAKRQAAARIRTFALINHDMRQPLQAMGISLVLLKHRCLDLYTATLIDRLIQATDCFSSFVEGLLDVSRLDAGVMAPRLESFDIHLMLTQLVNEFQEIAAEKKLALHYAPCHGLFVRSDPYLLQRILRNLISNAIRHTETGRILVGCRRKGQHEIGIEVLDTGPGIDAPTRSRVFNRNLQRGGSNQRGGLGLFIVAELAAILGHRISMQSEAGKGSRLAVTVPRTSTISMTDLPTTNPASLQRSALRILCLENARSVSASLRKQPATDACHIFTATNQRQLMDLLSAGIVPDVVITGPDLDEKIGMQMVAHLEQILKWPIPVIAISSDAERKHNTERPDRMVISESDSVHELFQAINALARPGRPSGVQT